MSDTLVNILADFDTQLAAPVSAGNTSATLVTATDDDGVALPTGVYSFTIDNGNSSKEYIICTLTSTALTNISTFSRQGAVVSGFARAHRRGAKVTLTDWGSLKRILALLNGTTNFNSLVKLGYDGDPGLNSGDTNKFATVGYANNLVASGAPDAGVATVGISEITAAPDVVLGAVTVTIASPAVATLAAHGLHAGDRVKFTTSGALPTGIVAGTTYYVIGTGLTANDFQISATLGGSAINTSGSQSGTHTLTRTTPRAVGENDTRLPTQNENNALAGTSGNPSTTNPYVTQNDTTNFATKTGTTIAFVDSNPDTITDSGNGFITAGFQVGQSIIITGSVSNNATRTITAVSAGSITVAESLVAEAAGATVTIVAAFIGKVLRTDPVTGALPAVSGVNLTNLGVPAGNELSLTAAEDLLANDSVYITANNTVTRYKPLATSSSTAATSSIGTAFGGSQPFKLLPIDSTHMLIVSGGALSSAQNGKCAIGTIDSNGQLTSITALSTYHTTASYYFDVCNIDNRYFALIYQDKNVTVNGIKVRIIDTNGGAISLGAVTTLETTGSDVWQVACTALDSSHIVVTYGHDADNHLYAQTLTTSGTTITTHTALDVNTGSSNRQTMGLVKFDTDRALLAYSIGGGSLKVAILDNSGTTLTAQSPVTVSSQTNVGQQYDIAMIFMMTNKLALAYAGYDGGGGTPTQAKAVVITVSGNTATVGTPTNITSNARSQLFYEKYLGICRISNSVFMINYASSAGHVNSNLVLTIDSSNLITYTADDDAGNSNNTAAVCITRPYRTYSYAYDGGGANNEIVTYTQPNPKHIGIVTTNTSAGSTTTPVALRWRTSNTYSGLTAGSEYYIDFDGQPTLLTSSVTVQYGTAINATKMFTV